jgi:hypothetical protein
MDRLAERVARLQAGQQIFRGPGLWRRYRHWMLARSIGSVDHAALDRAIEAQTIRVVGASSTVPGSMGAARPSHVERTVHSSAA